MTQAITKEQLKKIIFDAFKDVPKGAGLGARECVAQDDYASPEDTAKAKALDIEQHWYEYPKELISSGAFDCVINYNNEDGIKFHIPAMMTADIDGFGNITEISLFNILCLPGSYHFLRTNKDVFKFGPKYIEFLKSINVTDVINRFEFTSEQVHAIAMYLLFDMHHNESHDFFESKDKIIELIQYQLKHFMEHYKNMNIDVELARIDEERRIVNDWFKAGGVDVDEYVFEK